MTQVTRVDFTHEDGTITSFVLTAMPEFPDMYRQMRGGIYFRRIKNDDKTKPRPRQWNDYELRWTDKEDSSG